MGFETEGREQSEFNMAISYLSRLNQLFYICDEAAMELNIKQWFQTLIVLFRELSTEMKDEEITNIKKKIKLTSNLVHDYESNETSGNHEVGEDLYESLHELELDIRRVLKTSGLQLKMKDNPRRALKG